MLTSRKIEILKAIVESFISTAEPVGSKTLVEKFNLPYSSATIRNEMLELETLGFLEKTHTSSGRVPSTLGYRYYVEHLMVEKMDNNLQYALQEVFSDRQMKIEDVIKKSCDILAQMTNLTSMVLGPEAGGQTLEHINLFPVDQNKAVAVFITNAGHTENRVFQFEEKISVEELANCCAILNERLSGTPLDHIIEKLQLIKPILAQSIKQYEAIFEAFFNAFIKFANTNFYLSGSNNVFNQPEFTDINKLKQLMNMFENSKVWKDIGSNQNALRLDVSDHSSLVWMDDMAVITSTFKIDHEESGQLMVVGPSRMDYDRVVALMEFMSKAIEKIYGKGDSS
ncbi:MAG TPA: heat-inducible transcriptional repressor HrcA [Erysipelotrichaceae bacterium]|nr:heat-inducible transcriptional repressor HrcA [Erysipelotrichaceae bacterium]